jgi:hypothetical protein
MIFRIKTKSAELVQMVDPSGFSRLYVFFGNSLSNP